MVSISLGGAVGGRVEAVFEGGDGMGLDGVVG